MFLQHILQSEQIIQPQLQEKNQAFFSRTSHNKASCCNVYYFLSVKCVPWILSLNDKLVKIFPLSPLEGKKEKGAAAAAIWISCQTRCARIQDTSAWDRLIGYGSYQDKVLGRFVILGQLYLGKINPDQTTSDLLSL